MKGPRGPVDDDEGSILILTIGYAVLALVAVLVCANATSLYLAQKQLDSLADAAALAGADGFTISVDGTGEPIAALTSDGVRAQAESLVTDVGNGAALLSATTPDGLSARVTVAAVWHPPVITLFVPDGVPLQATATSRTALR
ncbi:pilus assembly protein TadG-related protein [Microbacterium sp. P03]|uniref:pilus assembly protein TadG-related protein n=1 Tax=Microbacterium sp. P03 TaxID=3366946 RepID=UPI003745346D